MDFGNAFDFTGKTVLVVGGSSGIGNAAARAFLAQGATVHVTGTKENARATMERSRIPISTG